MEQQTKQSKRKKVLMDMILISLFAVLIAVCSWISIPGPVPFTHQTMAVFTTVLLLGGKRGTITIILYMTLGMIGVPVFAGFSSGFAALFGMTGGYILGFLFIGLIKWGSEKLFGNSYLVLFLACLVGLIVCYAFGTGWFMVVYARTKEPIGLWSALMSCVIPFIIPDLAKLGVAILLYNRLHKFIKVYD